MSARGPRLSGELRMKPTPTNWRGVIRQGAVAFSAATMMFVQGASAQQMQRLYAGRAPGSETWNLPETARPSPDGGTIYGNVVDPGYTAYLPTPEKSNGASVILLPGGGLRALHVGSEAKAMIARFNAEGMAVFVLKYRVLQIAPTPLDRAQPTGAPPALPKLVIHNANANPAPNDTALSEVLDLAIDDTRAALRAIRRRAATYHIDPHRIGLIGSSAGGGVALGMLIRGGDDEAPSSIGTLYGPSLMDVGVQSDAPPLFIATESDHGPVTEGLVALYTLWRKAKRPVEMHIFDVPTFKMPASLWIDRYVDWMRENRFFGPPSSSLRK